MDRRRLGKSQLRLNLWELMKMIDQTLKNLWETKDSIAKEHGYDLEALVSYLQFKSRSRDGNVFQDVKTKDAEQVASADARTSRG